MCAQRYCIPDPSVALTDEILMKQIAPASRVIDLGCGDGRLLERLREEYHCKVLGIFTRLWLRDAKPGYLGHIPRVWRLLEAALVHPGLLPIREWLDETLPPARRIVPEQETVS